MLAVVLAFSRASCIFISGLLNILNVIDLNKRHKKYNSFYMNLSSTKMY